MRENSKCLNKAEDPCSYAPVKNARPEAASDRLDKWGCRTGWPTSAGLRRANARRSSAIDKGRGIRRNA